MLAKAVATEGGATFLTIDASVVESKWLGESEKNAKAVFTLARRLAPCVVYLDEVDSILSSREQGDESSHGTLTSVKTTLMQEWDGLRTTKDRYVLLFLLPFMTNYSFCCWSIILKNNETIHFRRGLHRNVCFLFTSQPLFHPFYTHQSGGDSFHEPTVRPGRSRTPTVTAPHPRRPT